MNRAHYATRRGSSTLHVITGIHDWYSGMTVTTECGVKQAEVLEEKAVRERLHVTTCKRCIRTLGWNYPKRVWRDEER